MKYMLLIYEHEAHYAGEAGEKLLADIIAGHHVFTEELIETYITYKRRHEADAVRLRPHPYEFALYYDI